MSDIKQDKISKEVSEKYTIKNDAFVQVAKDNIKDLIVCEIGDTKDPTKFQNQMKICRWGDTPDDNEVNVSVRLIEDELGTAEVSTDKDKIIWKKGNIETHFYDVLDGEGGKEMEVVFLSKPKSNVVQMSVNVKDAEFFYQPALTPEEIAQGASTPENVEGSYAVYAKTPKTNYTGGKEYKCGKIGHIFRPKIIDSAGAEVWGDLHIENGILSVTIPQEFLDNAIYPVRHAAGLTFGYTSVGGSSDGWNTDYAVAYKFISSQDGTVDSVTSYGRGYLSNTKNCIWSTSNGSIITNGISNPTNHNNTNSWNIGIFSTPPSVSNATYYWLGFVISRSYYYYYDSGSSNYGQYDSSNSYATPQSISTTGNSSQKLSIYATYTAGGGGGQKPQVNVGDVWKQSTAVQVNIGDAWKPVTKMQVNVGDVWKVIF